MSFKCNAQYVVSDTLSWWWWWWCWFIDSIMVIPKCFWSQGLFILLDIIEHPKGLLFVCILSTNTYCIHNWNWELFKIFEGLTYGIMKTENSHDLLSACWSPKKASGIVPLQTWRPENHGRQWCKSHSEFEVSSTWAPVSSVLGQEKIDVPACTESRFVFLIFSSPYQIGWLPTLVRVI